MSIESKIEFSGKLICINGLKLNNRVEIYQ